MEIKMSSIGSVDIATIQGRVDASNSSEVESALSKLIDSGTRKILIDLQDLVYISSSGLRVFLLIAKKLEKTGKIGICHMQSQVEQIFTISGFNNIFSIFGNKEEAIAFMNQAS